MFTSYFSAARVLSSHHNTQVRTGTGDPMAGHLSAAKASAGRWALRVMPILLLLVSFQVEAATNYVFPGNLPAGCAYDTNSASAPVKIFNCGALTLAAGDAILLTGATQINIDGDFNTGASARLNANGNSANLNIYVAGITYLGDYTILHGNIFGTNNTTGTITTGANSQVVGNLTTTTAGVINVGNGGTVTGDLTTKSGAINVGDNATIKGSILSTLAGAITVGVNAKVTGSISSTGSGSGSGAGAITIGDNSIIDGGISTNTGAITIQVGSKVGGDIVTNDGAITVATNVNVSGSVCTGNSGAITIGASANVAGNVETAKAGAITVGTKANVGGGVTVHGAGARTIAADATVGQTIGSTCGVPAAPHVNAPRIISRDWRQLFMR